MGHGPHTRFLIAVKNLLQTVQIVDNPCASPHSCVFSVKSIMLKAINAAGQICCQLLNSQLALSGWGLIRPKCSEGCVIWARRRTEWDAKPISDVPSAHQNKPVPWREPPAEAGNTKKSCRVFETISCGHCPKDGSRSPGRYKNKCSFLITGLCK